MSDNIFNKVQIQTLRFGPISQCNYLVKYTSDHFLLELTDHGIFATFKDANVAEEVFTYCRIDRGDRIHFWDCKLKVGGFWPSFKLFGPVHLKCLL